MTREHGHDSNMEHNHLQLNADPEYIEMESLLDALSEQDRKSAPDELETRVIQEVSKVLIPAPIPLHRHPTRSDQVNDDLQSEPSRDRFWGLRIAAGIAIIGGVGLTFISLNPLNQMNTTNPNSDVSIVSMTQNLDDYLALDELDHQEFDSALSDWEVWADSVEMDVDTQLDNLDPFASDGAL